MWMRLVVQQIPFLVKRSKSFLVCLYLGAGVRSPPGEAGAGLHAHSLHLVGQLETGWEDTAEFRMGWDSTAAEVAGSTAAADPVAVPDNTAHVQLGLKNMSALSLTQTRLRKLKSLPDRKNRTQEESKDVAMLPL